MHFFTEIGHGIVFAYLAREYAFQILGKFNFMHLFYLSVAFKHIPGWDSIVWEIEWNHHILSCKQDVSSCSTGGESAGIYFMYASNQAYALFLSLSNV